MKLCDENNIPVLHKALVSFVSTNDLFQSITSSRSEPRSGQVPGHPQISSQCLVCFATPGKQIQIEEPSHWARLYPENRSTWCIMDAWLLRPLLRHASIEIMAWIRNNIYRYPAIRHTGQQFAFRYSIMMTSLNGNIFRVTGHLCEEFTGPRWILHTKAGDAEPWCFLWSASG